MKKYINIIRPEKLKVSGFLLMFALGFPFFAASQTTPTPSENYTYTKIYLSEDGSRKSESVQYFDDLGRPKQRYTGKSHSLGQDLVVPMYTISWGGRPKAFCLSRCLQQILEYRPYPKTQPIPITE